MIIKLLALLWACMTRSIWRLHLTETTLDAPPPRPQSSSWTCTSMWSRTARPGRRRMTTAVATTPARRSRVGSACEVRQSPSARWRWRREYSACWTRRSSHWRRNEATSRPQPVRRRERTSPQRSRGHYRRRRRKTHPSTSTTAPDSRRGRWRIRIRRSLCCSCGRPGHTSRTRSWKRRRRDVRRSPWPCRIQADQVICRRPSGRTGRNPGAAGRRRESSSSSGRRTRCGLCRPVHREPTWSRCPCESRWGRRPKWPAHRRQESRRRFSWWLRWARRREAAGCVIRRCRAVAGSGRCRCHQPTARWWTRSRARWCGDGRQTPRLSRTASCRLSPRPHCRRYPGTPHPLLASGNRAPSSSCWRVPEAMGKGSLAAEEGRSPSGEHRRMNRSGRTEHPGACLGWRRCRLWLKHRPSSWAVWYRCRWRDPSPARRLPTSRRDERRWTPSCDTGAASCRSASLPGTTESLSWRSWSRERTVSVDIHQRNRYRLSWFDQLAVASVSIGSTVIPPEPVPTRQATRPGLSTL